MQGTDASVSRLLCSQTDKSGLKDHVEHDLKGLKKIGGLDLSQAQIDALLKWKHEH